MTNYPIEKITKGCEQLIEESLKDVNGRYQSWEHCYSIFALSKGKRLTSEQEDTLCLHLGFYLASWGMMRGSSQLLQKGYKVHKKAVKELMKEEYSDLWAVRCERFCGYDHELDKLFVLYVRLCKIYQGFGVSATDTLITKILMGTLGCTPAYDRIFNAGVKGKSGSYLTFNRKSIVALSRFYVEHHNELERLREFASLKSINQVEYPQMKILDMCFWQMGAKMDAKSN